MSEYADLNDTLVKASVQIDDGCDYTKQLVWQMNARRCKQVGFIYKVDSVGDSWDAALKRAGIRRRKAYQSRHTYACWSLSAGANPSFIANQMGHASAQMVFNVYGAWMADSSAEQIAMLNQKLSDFAPQMPHSPHNSKRASLKSVG